MKVPLLSRLGKEYLTKSHYFIKLASFQRGELVFNEGDSVDKIYIIKKGVFNVSFVEDLYIYIYILLYRLRKKYRQIFLVMELLNYLMCIILKLEIENAL